jgi:hypothetical protein
MSTRLMIQNKDFARGARRSTGRLFLTVFRDVRAHTNPSIGIVF